MAVGLPQSFTFRDAKNQTATVKMAFVQGADANADQAAVATIRTDLAALTNASVKGGGFYNAAAPVTGATTGKFQDIEDKAVFYFQTAAGSIHKYQIPAPKDTLFLADLETVDFTVGVVSTFVTDMLANVVSLDGAALTASIGAQRIRRKAQRKFNIRTRNPTLTGQGL